MTAPEKLPSRTEPSSPAKTTSAMWESPRGCLRSMRAVTFALRPKEPGRKVKLRVLQDGKVLAEKTVPRALPAEMVHIAVDKDAWAGSGPVKVVMSDD